MIFSKKRKLAFPQLIGGGGDPEGPDHYSFLRTLTKIQERIQASKGKREKGPRKKRVASVPSCLRTFRKDQCWTQPKFYVHQEGGLDQKFLGHELLWGGWALQCWKQERELWTKRKTPQKGDKRWCGGGTGVEIVCARQTQTLTLTVLRWNKKRKEKQPRLQPAWFSPTWSLAPGKSELRWPVSIVCTHGRMGVSQNRHWRKDHSAISNSWRSSQTEKLHQRMTHYGYHRDSYGTRGRASRLR